MKIFILLISAAVVLSSGCAGESDYAAPVREDIGAAMREQVDSWNAGELTGFMKYYWRSDEMTFHGGKKRLQFFIYHDRPAARPTIDPARWRTTGYYFPAGTGGRWLAAARRLLSR